ncbi:anti-sigma factor family protein [Chloroflexota bacterium]
MTTRISPKEWEALSAYMDGQLSTNDRIRLERLLTERPEMLVALKDLRRTRDFLRSQPRLRAPRNFTLSPQLAGVRLIERRSSFAFPVLSAVSALASILFVLVFVGDMLITGAGPSQNFVAQAPVEVYPVVEETVLESFSPAEDELQEIPPTEKTLQDVQVPSVAAEGEVIESMMEEEIDAVSKVIETVDESRTGGAIQTPILEPVSPDFEAVPGGKAEHQPGIYDEDTGQLEPSVDQDITSTARLIEKLPLLKQRSTMRILEVILIMIALSTGLAALYILRIGNRL